MMKRWAVTGPLDNPTMREIKIKATDSGRDLFYFRSFDTFFLNAVDELDAWWTAKKWAEKHPERYGKRTNP